MSELPRLSKSRFINGLQCHRQLWWRVHEPESPELTPDEARQAIFDQGVRVGAVARGYVPGGVLVDAPHDDFDLRFEQTRRALDRDAPAVYEAAFEADGVFVAVDILERRDEGFGLIEVKSSTRLKDEYVPDAAIQLQVARAAGLRVDRAEVMHLNRACRFPRLENLFTRVDVTSAAEALLANIPDLARAQRAMLGGTLPEVPIGEHCEKPWPCPFHGRCWEPTPPHHVSELYALRRRAAELEGAGYSTIDRLPEGLGLGAIAERQRRAVRSGQMVIEPGLDHALEALRPPIAYLDFETLMPAIPLWDGCRPYDQVPVQFSCHLVDSRGSVRHVEWLADGGADPRRTCAERLLDACERAGTLVAYNAPFERTRMRELADALPDLAERLGRIEARTVDALAWLRDHVYHPDFHGSFSLKQVLPVLVPEVTYDDLPIAEGATASRALHRLLLEPERMPEDERLMLRRALLDYCARDTWATFKLVERLRGLAN